MQRKLLELKRKLFMVMGIMLCFICFTGITVNAAEHNAETLGDSSFTFSGSFSFFIIAIFS